MTAVVPGVDPALRESRRQRAVESLGLAEPVRNPQLDRISRIARTIFGVDMSSITVLDNDRALFVGRGGFDVDEAPRFDTPCRLVIDSGELIMTDDARTDERFDDVANIRDNDLGFYLGHPLMDGSGNVIGSLCLIDKQPRALSPSEMSAFEDLADWARAELVADAEAERARVTQQALLPSTALEHDGFRVVGVCVPASSVGGDYYDYGIVGSLMHIAIGDVMGKGTAAAIIGAATRSACRAVVPTVTDGASLGRAVDLIERAMIGDLQRTGTFVTYWHAVIDTAAAELTYVDAGAGLALLVRADGTSEQLTGSELPLGIERHEHGTQSRQLVAGDRLVLVSDGLLDIVDDPNAWADEVDGLVRAASDGQDALNRLAALSQVRQPVDDVTIVVLEYHP